MSKKTGTVMDVISSGVNRQCSNLIWLAKPTGANTWSSWELFYSQSRSLQSTRMVTSLALVAGAIAVLPLRRLLKSIIPQPGSGPTEEKMDEGWFRCELLGWGSEGQRVRSKPIDLPQSKRYNLTKAGFDTN